MKNAAVRIGRVRSGLVVHLAIYGSTCSSLRPVRVEVNERAATARLCKSCFTPARIVRAQQANSFGKTFSATVANLLAAICDIRDEAENPGQREASRAKFAETAFARDIAAAAAAPPFRHRTFAEIRAALNPTTVDPDQLAFALVAA